MISHITLQIAFACRPVGVSTHLRLLRATLEIAVATVSDRHIAKGRSDGLVKFVVVRNGELICKAAAAARTHDAKLYAVFRRFARIRLEKPDVQAADDDAILAPTGARDSCGSNHSKGWRAPVSEAIPRLPDFRQSRHGSSVPRLFWEHHSIRTVKRGEGSASIVLGFKHGN